MNEKEAIAKGAQMLNIDARDVLVRHGEGHAGIGWYAWDADYPEDGAVRVDMPAQNAEADW